jgi:hypothetical protein
MVFFNFQQGSNGKEDFQISTHWWYYLAATLPLTAVVFTIWTAWQKWQTIEESFKVGKAKKRDDVDVEMVKFV